MASAANAAASHGFRFLTVAISGAPALFTSGALAAAEAPGIAFQTFQKHSPWQFSTHTQLAADAAAGPGFQFPSVSSLGAPGLLASGAPAAAEAPGMAVAAVPLGAIPAAPVPGMYTYVIGVHQINLCHRPLGSTKISCITLAHEVYKR